MFQDMFGKVSLSDLAVQFKFSKDLTIGTAATEDLNITGDPWYPGFNRKTRSKIHLLWQKFEPKKIQSTFSDVLYSIWYLIY